jgi:sulfite exporter TauE/SafE
MSKLLLSFFIIGLSFGVGPCLASCGPLLISYAAGTSNSLVKSAIVYLLFSLARILVYVVISLCVFLFGHALASYTLGNYSRFIYISGGLFIAIVGLSVMFGKDTERKFCQSLQNIFLKKDTKTVIMLGLIVGILPCAPLISVLSYVGLASKHWLDSLLCGLFFGLGTLVSPLFILVVFSGFIGRLVAQKNKFYRVFNLICGLIIVFLGSRLITRSF